MAPPQCSIVPLFHPAQRQQVVQYGLIVPAELLWGECRALAVPALPRLRARSPSRAWRESGPWSMQTTGAVHGKRNPGAMIRTS